MSLNRISRAACRRLGIQHVGRRRVRDLIDFIEDRGIDLVLDVGANVGQFGEWLRRAGYRGRIVSFEPGNAEFAELAHKARADGKWVPFHCGLGASAGKATLHVSRLSVFNSLLDLSAAAPLHDERMVVDHTEEIEVRTLDAIAAPLAGRMLLKIDTQGYERQVLEGGRDVLKRMAGVLLELPVIHTYEGQWDLEEGLRYMAEVGFVPAQILPVGFHTADPVAAVEFDCLFRPRSEIDGAEASQGDNETASQQAGEPAKQREGLIRE
jgi:FkbM family methyltransferase